MQKLAEALTTILLIDGRPRWNAYYRTAIFIVLSSLLVKQGTIIDQGTEIKYLLSNLTTDGIYLNEKVNKLSVRLDVNTATDLREHNRLADKIDKAEEEFYSYSARKHAK